MLHKFGDMEVVTGGTQPGADDEIYILEPTRMCL